MSDVTFLLVYVEDVAVSQSFYASILGREAVDSTPTFAMLPAAPNLMLGLWKRDGVKPPVSGVNGGEIAFTAPTASAVDALHDEWRGRGVPMAQAPTAMDFGYTFVALDPDGGRLRVFAPHASEAADPAG